MVWLCVLRRDVGVAAHVHVHLHLVEPGLHLALEGVEGACGGGHGSERERGARGDGDLVHSFDSSLWSAENTELREA